MVARVLSDSVRKKITIMNGVKGIYECIFIYMCMHMCFYMCMCVYMSIYFLWSMVGRVLSDAERKKITIMTCVKGIYLCIFIYTCMHVFLFVYVCLYALIFLMVYGG